MQRKIKRQKIIINGKQNSVSSSSLYSSKFINHITIINFNFIDEDEIYNNPNLHSEEQDELEIPDGQFFQIL